MQKPLQLVKLRFELFGIYSLPDSWKTAINNLDAAESAQNYEIEIAGVKMSGGKPLPRELTKEEKAAADAAAATKGKPPPPAKGKPGAAEEKTPTADEILTAEKAVLEEE